MKKVIAFLTVGCILAVSLFVNIHMRETIKYTVLNKEELSELLYNELLVNAGNRKFNIYHDEQNTYVYYQADHLPNEYITTNLSVSKKRNHYILTASVGYAVNDNYVSYDRIIKVDKVPERNIILKEVINIK